MMDKHQAKQTHLNHLIAAKIFRISIKMCVNKYYSYEKKLLPLMVIQID